MDAEILRRKRGGQPGNRNRLKHGDFSAARIARRKEISQLLRKARHAVTRAKWIARARKHWIAVAKKQITMLPSKYNPLVVLNFFDPGSESGLQISPGLRDRGGGEGMEAIIDGAAAFNRAAKGADWHSLCDVTLRFNHPDLARLLSLWRSEAGENPIPFRRTMSPRLLKSFLRDVAIYERVGEGLERRYRVRLMGTAFAQILGDLTGKFIDEAIPAEFVPLWHASLDATLGAGAPLRFLGREDTKGMTFLTGEFFSAPLLADDGRANLVIAAARYSGKRPWEEVDAETRKLLGLD